MKKITGVVDYGLGNLYSVLRGLKAAGASSKIVKAADIINCDYLILPGVGAFGDGINNIIKLGIQEALYEYVETGRPFLGICLGTQLLLSLSEEFGSHKGLGLIKGEVKEIEPIEGLAVPHVGWAPLVPGNNWNVGIFKGIKETDEFYFTHSYSCFPEHDENVLAWFQYGPHKLVAAVIRENVMGCQFHPELSSFPGINILKHFHSL